jgi:hypothetical protein
MTGDPNLFNRLFGLLNQLKPGDRPLTGQEPTNGPIWSYKGSKHVFLTSELSTEVTPKLQLPFPKKLGILMITIDAPLGGWNLTGHQHPFGPYGYGFDIVDISAERTFPSKVAQTFLDDWDGVCITGHNAPEIRYHLIRTGLFELIRHRVSEGMFYLGVNAGAVLAADDLSQLLPSGNRTRGLALIPKTVLPFSDTEQVQHVIDVLNDHFGADEPIYVGVKKNGVAHFRDDVLEIR